MIEIPILHGKKIEDFGRRELAESYCQVVRSIFFEEPLWNGTPEFTRVFPFGFLLYSSANPEMIMFMGQDGIWDFLDTITRKKFFVFSVRPEAGGKAITPRMTSPGIGHMAYCVDTEGTQFGLMQSDPSAQPAES